MIIILFAFLISIQNALASEKSTIIVAFPKLENSSITGTLVSKGISISIEHYPELKETLQFIHIEPERNAKLASEEILKAIDRYRPVAIIGAITSNIALALGSLSEERKIPFITPLATHPEVTQNKKYVFRTCFDDNLQAKKLAEFSVSKLKRQRISILINENNAYSVEVGSLFSKRAEELGATIVLKKLFQSNKDFTTELVAEIKKTKPQIIFIPSYQIEAASIISILKDNLAKDTIFLGPDSWGGGRLFHSIFQESKSSFTGYYVQHFSLEKNSKLLKKKLRKLKQTKQIKELLKESNTAMLAPVIAGYDAGLTLLEAIKIQRQKKIDLVHAIKKVDLMGISGRISFSKNQTPTSKPIYLYTINHKEEKFFMELK